MDEKDVKGNIKREDFEKLSSHLWEKIRIPCCKAVFDSGLSPENIHTIELVGSRSWIPAIMKVLTALFKREPSWTLNVSECVAHGCALQCAMLSPTFRVKEYEVCTPQFILYAFKRNTKGWHIFPFTKGHNYILFEHVHSSISAPVCYSYIALKRHVLRWDFLEVIGCGYCLSYNLNDDVLFLQYKWLCPF